MNIALKIVKMDWLRKVFLLAGFSLIYGAFESSDPVIGTFGVLLIYKAWYNISCASGKCDIGS